MLTQLVKNSLVALVVSLLLFSCGKEEQAPHSDYIPSNASIVYAVNVESMLTKVGKEKLLDLSFFSDLFSQDPEQKEMMQKINNSGIDYLNTMYIYLTQEAVGQSFGDVNPLQPNLQEAKTPTIVVLPLEDASKLQATVQQEYEGAEVKKNGDLSYALLDDVTLGWKENVAIAIVFAKDPEQELLAAFDDGREKLSEANEQFSSFLSEEFDLSLFADFTGIKAMLDKTGSLPSNWFPANTSTLFVNFKDGKIEGNGCIAFADDFQGDAILKETVNPEFTKAMPEADPLALLALNIDINSLYKFVQENNLERAIQNQIGMTGLSVEQFLMMFSGEISLAVGPTPGMPFLPVGMYLQMGVTDKDNFKKLTSNLMSQFGGMSQNPDQNYMVFNGVHIVAGEDRLVATTNEEKRKAYQAGENGTIPEKFMDMASNSSMILLLDLNRGLDKAKQSGIGNLPNNADAPYADVFDMLLFRTGSLAGKEMQMELSVTLKDSDRNSLMVLMEAAQESSKQPS